MLSEDTFFTFAMNNYKRSSCTSLEEFSDDLKKIKHIKKHFTRFIAGEDVNLRLVVNHIIIFYNVFDVSAATRILFFKTEQSHWVLLATFLTYLNFMPEYIEDLNLTSESIGIDSKLFKRLELL